jgi:hypothetical protein
MEMGGQRTRTRVIYIFSESGASPTQFVQLKCHMTHDIVDCTSVAEFSGRRVAQPKTEQLRRRALQAYNWHNSILTQCARVLSFSSRPVPSAFRLPPAITRVPDSGDLKPLRRPRPPPKGGPPQGPDGGPLLAWSALVDRYRAGQSALRVASTMHGSDAPPFQPLSLASSPGALRLLPTTRHCLRPQCWRPDSSLPKEARRAACSASVEIFRAGQSASHLASTVHGCRLWLARASGERITPHEFRKAKGLALTLHLIAPSFSFSHRGGGGSAHTKGGHRCRSSREPPPDAHHPARRKASPRPSTSSLPRVVAPLVLLLPQRRELCTHQ